MQSKNGSRARGHDWTFDSSPHGGCLERTRHVDTEATGLAEDRNRERKSVERDLGQRREAAVVDLLLAAGEVELDHFHEVRVLEVGHGWIVESDVPVFADSHANEIDGLLSEQRSVARSDCGGVFFLSGQRVKTGDRNMPEEMLSKVVPETLRMGGSEADVVVHVKRGDPRPIDDKAALSGINERSEKFVLRRRAREYHAGFALTGDDTVEVGRDGAGRRAAQRRTINMDFDREAAGGQIMG